MCAQPVVCEQWGDQRWLLLSEVHQRGRRLWLRARWRRRRQGVPTSAASPLRPKGPPHDSKGPSVWPRQSDQAVVLVHTQFGSQELCTCFGHAFSYNGQRKTRGCLHIIALQSCRYTVTSPL